MIKDIYSDSVSKRFSTLILHACISYSVIQGPVRKEQKKTNQNHALDNQLQFNYKPGIVKMWLRILCNWPQRYNLNPSFFAGLNSQKVAQ